MRLMRLRQPGIQHSFGFLLVHVSRVLKFGPNTYAGQTGLVPGPGNLGTSIKPQTAVEVRRRIPREVFRLYSAFGTIVGVVE